MIKKRLIDDEGQINITPMLDVVFIMLIFFIVTTSFAKETGVDISRPTSSAGPSKKGNILIEVEASGEILVNKQSTSLAAVRSRIDTIHAEHPEHSAVLVAHSDARTGVLVQVMDHIKSAGVDRISVASATTD